MWHRRGPCGGHVPQEGVMWHRRGSYATGGDHMARYYVAKASCGEEITLHEDRQIIS